jgi:uncharacterized protein YkwD
MKAERYLKSFIALLLAVTAMTAQLPSQLIKTAYAQEIGVTKAATLNNIKVSCNGAEPVTIQAYNVDGVNYARVKDITDGLNMYVEVLPEVLGEKSIGVRIHPNRPAANPGNLEKLTSANIRVTLLEGGINYMHMRTLAQCFIYGGRYYFSLEDIDKASKTSLPIAIELVKDYAASPYATGPAEDSYTAIDVVNDTQTGVININRNVTDLWVVYNQARSGVPAQEPTSLEQTTEYMLSDDYKASVRDEFYKILNEHRVSNGLNALAINTELETYADMRVSELKVKVGHARPDGSPAGSGWYNSDNTLNTRYAESVRGIDSLNTDPKITAIKIFAGWEASQGHNHHMLYDFNADTKMALGIVPEVDENGNVTSGAVFATGY